MARDYLFQNVQTTSGAHMASSCLGMWVSVLGVKPPGCEVDQRAPSSAMVKNECSYSLFPSYAFVACTGTTLSLTSHFTMSVRKLSSHFEYLENRSRGLDVTWQPGKGDLLHVHEQSLSHEATQSAVRYC